MYVRWQPPVDLFSAPVTFVRFPGGCCALARPVEPPFGLESWTESDDQIFGFLDALSRSRLARPLRRGREALRRPQVAGSSDRGRYGFELAGPVLEAVARRGTPLFRMWTKLVVVLVFFLGLVTIPAVVSTLDRMAIQVRGIPVGSVWVDLWLPSGTALALVGVAGLVWLLEKSTYRSHRPLTQPPKTSTKSQPATTGPDWGVQFPKAGTGSGKVHTITTPRI